jgi:hypothetical protein
MSIQQFRSGFHGNTSRLVVELFKLEPRPSAISCDRYRC